jgi:hypothetical protein
VAELIRNKKPDNKRMNSVKMRCGFHPLLARREAPRNQRIHLTASVHDPFGLMPRFAGDPQRVSSMKMEY